MFLVWSQNLESNRFNIQFALTRVLSRAIVPMTMAFFIAACGNLATATPIPFEIAGHPAGQTLTELTTYGFTHQRPDGNPYVPGRSSFPNVRHLDIALDGPQSGWQRRLTRAGLCGLRWLETAMFRVFWLRIDGFLTWR
ncbi:MAG: hypothetical protein CL732_02820 [Chloroflexi bacterium]|nr:hypothetical protein [Chloroflexota bacterium]